MNKILPQVETSTVTWMPIDKDGRSLPDAGIEVLVYDGYLDDVVIGYVDYLEDLDRGDDASTIVWRDLVANSRLKDPQFWADVPFPGVK